MVHGTADMTHGTFCTVFDCMDGRCQGIVGEWVRKNFGVEYPDTITVAGIDGVVVKDAAECERIMGLARISAEVHGAKQAAIAGHSCCAGFPVSDDEHKSAIMDAAKKISDSGMYQTVVGLFVSVEAGTVTEVCRLTTAGAQMQKQLIADLVGEVTSN